MDQTRGSFKVRLTWLSAVFAIVMFVVGITLGYLLQEIF